MTFRCLTAVLAIASIAIAGGTVRADNPVHTPVLAIFWTPPPDGCTGEVIWGLTRQRLEIARGTLPAAEQLNTAVSPTQPLILDLEIADISPEDLSGLRFHLCCNRDAWDSYIPSFGDSWQTVPVTRNSGRLVARPSADGWRQRTPVSTTGIVRVHYHRFEGDYTDASLWVWNPTGGEPAEADKEIRPVGLDAFGAVFQLDPGRYEGAEARIGVLPRQRFDWQYKDGGDRFWTPLQGEDIYLVQNSNVIYSEAPDVSPKIQSATLDADHHITVKFTHRVPKAEWTPERFTLRTDDGSKMAITAVHPFDDPDDRTSLFSLETGSPLEFLKHRYQLDVEGLGTIEPRIGHILRNTQRLSDPTARLGATYQSASTTFRVFAPTAESAWVVVADDVVGRDGYEEHAMECNEHGVWASTVSGDLNGRFYAYRFGGDGFNADEELTDIYATCTQGRRTRTLITDLDATDPEGFSDKRFQPPTSPVDAVIYEMHVRDFTISPTSGVKQKGLYLGLTETGTHVPGEEKLSTALDHLVELGVTHVQLMPVQDFDNFEDGDDAYNWGYMPCYFNSPDGWYATATLGPSRIVELKKAIKAFHDRGIGVILDVVYNHTAGHVSFNDIVPGYYFRMTDSGDFANGSGCGNEFCSEAPMARKYIIDSLKYWVSEYHVDGFRFDLMGLIDLDTLKQARTELRRINPAIMLYGEPWTGGGTPLNPITDKSRVRGSGLAAFNDHFRDAIKGGRDDGPPGFIQCGDDAIGIVHGLLGGIDDWSSRPTEAVNYFEAHDNLTAWDKLVQSAPMASDTDRRRMMRFGGLMILAAQGTPFIHSGQEFCRTKKGSHNSYNQPDEINQIDWLLKKSNRDVYEYYRGMIALRKAHPVFRLRTAKEVRQRAHFEAPPHPQSVVLRLNGSGLEGESAKEMLVLLNGAIGPTEFPLPEGVWIVYADADRAGVKPLTEIEGKVTLPANSGLIIAR